MFGFNVPRLTARRIGVAQADGGINQFSSDSLLNAGSQQVQFGPAVQPRSGIVVDRTCQI